MKNQKLLILSSLALGFILILAGIVGALIRLISLQAFLITALLLLPLIIQKYPSKWQKILRFNRLKGSPNELFNEVPLNRKEAAERSLESIDKLIERIQNNVALEGLKQQRKRVENELKRKDLEIVVFGTGSSGKTSLIRALLNEIVGNVSSAMGSTTKSISYRLRLKGLDRAIKIIDTPGILEGGKEGRLRERSALIKASQSDLILFVVDSDLREAEYEIIQGLADIGKRFFLVLNKVDLRTEEEEQQLLTILRGRTKGLIAHADIIATTSSPQSIPMPGRHPIQPQPEIDDLVRRLAKVLYEDGEELLADNILLQCRNLNRSGQELLDKQREENASRCVERYSWISSGVVIITPLPGIELLGTAAVNTQMVIEIAKVYGIELTKSRAKELAISVGRTLTGLGIVQGGVSMIGSALSLNLPTIVLGRVIQSITAAWLTRVAGQSFITFFKQDQDWGDGGIQEEVQRQYDINRREQILDEFLESALNKVVKPLRKNRRTQLPPHQMLRVEEEASDHGHP